MDYLKSFMQRNKAGDTDIFRLEMKHYGFQNRNKILYYIYENNAALGFFAMYRYWMEYLYFADICGYTPIICTSRKCAYREEGAVAGTHNVFEYFFRQPSNIGIKEAKHSSKVILSDIVHREMVELILTGRTNHYGYTEKYLREMGEILSKYIIFNDHTMQYLNEELKKFGMDNKKVLGIHIRGTDFRGKYNNHPVFVTEEDCFIEIDKIFEKNGYDQIFVATDDQRILRGFMARYGDSVYFYPDVVRGSTNKSVMLSKDSRKHHKYLLGLEVIRDMYTLSMCSGLIAGVSQVAICAQINKVARGEKYDDIKIINKGIYQNNRQFHI